MSEDQTNPPKKTGRSARNPIDWEALKAEWLPSGIPKAEFLRTKGINPNAGNAQRSTKSWIGDLKKAHEHVTGAYIASVSNKEVAQIVSAQIDPTAKQWREIVEWRAEQCRTDYQLAGNIRTIIKLILSQATKEEIDPKTGKTKIVCTLLPGQVNQLAQAHEKVQRIQRLSLGMSTDNVGVNPPPAEPQAPTEASPDDGVPTFEILMSRGGRFQSVRPRQVK